VEGGMEWDIFKIIYLIILTFIYPGSVIAVELFVLETWYKSYWFSSPVNFCYSKYLKQGGTGLGQQSSDIVIEWIVKEWMNQ
jgi:hypothetical protein